MPKIKVIDQGTEQVLFECEIKDAEKAYQYAAQMEELGLDVKVINPSLSETLTTSLGLSKEEVAAYEASMEQELEDHDGSCCAELHDPNKTVH